MSMPKAVCPMCHETLYGWSIEYLDRMPCPYCGATLRKEDMKDDSLSSTPDKPSER